MDSIIGDPTHNKASVGGRGDVGLRGSSAGSTRRSGEEPCQQGLLLVIRELGSLEELLQPAFAHHATRHTCLGKTPGDGMVSRDSPATIALQRRTNETNQCSNLFIPHCGRFVLDRTDAIQSSLEQLTKSLATLLTHDALLVEHVSMLDRIDGIYLGL
jgi:hypothetical protein